MLCFSQKETLQESRLYADTMKFSNPIEFIFNDTVNELKGVIYKKCYEWLYSNLIDFNNHIQTQDSIRGKLVLINIDILYSNTERITISVYGGGFRMKFDNFQNRSDPNHIRPLDLKSDKDFKLYLYLIFKDNRGKFQDISEYVKKND